MQLQEYNLQIKLISGTQNFFADILSGNPAGLTPDLRKLQSRKQEDPSLQKLKEEIQAYPG
jgi:hypothetical protein